MSRRSFAGATVAITGGAAGLGRALAFAFGRAGGRVALLDLDRDGLQQTGADLHAAGIDAVALACDVTDERACMDAVEACVARFGRLDVAIANAGMSHRSAFASTDPAVLRRVMAVNFYGAVHLARAALPHLQRTRGALAAISSVAGFSPLIARTGYAASKHALHGFFDSLRAEVAPDGVDVTLVCPSFIATGIDRHALGARGAPAAHAQVVVGERLSPADVAAAILRAVARRRRLVLVGGTAHAAWWLHRIAPALYERVMARRLRDEMR